MASPIGSSQEAADRELGPIGPVAAAPPGARGCPRVQIIRAHLPGGPVWREVVQGVLTTTADQHWRPGPLPSGGGTLLAAGVIVHVVHGARGVEAPAGFLTVVFATPRWTGEAVNLEPGKHMCVTWAPITAIPRDCVSGIRHVITSYLRTGATITLDGWRRD